MRKRKESDIQLSIIKYLHNIGADCGKTKTMGVKRGRSFCFDPYVFRGFPDLCCFYKQNFFFIEVKSENGKLSEHQLRFQELCKQVAIPYIVARSVDDVVKIVQPDSAFPLV